MAGRDREGFQPCTLGDGVGPPLARWERSIVASALVVHVADVGLDILVVLLFLSSLQWAFFFASAGVVVGAAVVSGLYVSFGASAQAGGGAGAVETSAQRLRRFVFNFTQVQIFSEAYRCVVRGGESDYFHTLRLLEALLEAAPSALVQLYALVLWAGTAGAPAYAAPLLRHSVLASLASVGLGLAMWEQKVQIRASCAYVAGVAVLRAFEACSRSLTIALFAGLTHPYGLWWVLALDYGVMLLLIARHRSVHLTYGFFVALPLVLVSLEPLVWRRQDHAVPKDAYYAVRVLESLVMWARIARGQGQIDERVDSYALWIGGEVLALVSTLGLYCLLPFVWRAARQQELSRDVDNWEDVRGEDDLTDSEASGSSGSEGRLVDGRDLQGELPPE